MTFDIGLHEVCVRAGWVAGRAGVRYVITKFSRMDSSPNFLAHGAPPRARGAPLKSVVNLNTVNPLVCPSGGRIYFKRFEEVLIETGRDYLRRGAYSI